MALLLYLLAFSFVSYSASLEPSLKDESPEFRLPADTIKVLSYDIYLKMEEKVFDQDNFTGEVIVSFTILKSVDNIKIHANGLEIDEVFLKDTNGEEKNLQNEEYKSDAVTDILTITVETQLNAEENYTLEFKYKGLLRTDEMYGWYKSSYIDPEGNTRYLATTQFQATHARKVFPCFDEPLYKATFKIKIEHPSEYTAIGNTEKTTETDPLDSSYTITEFAETPRMSTYLVAFIVSDFTCDESEEPIEDGVVHSVCSREEEKSNRKVALEAGPKLVHILENFTQSKYSEPGITKMHQVAIPDFSAGAMENWGLLTYREIYLLWDPEQSSNSNLQSIKNVIAHEIAHMWFGNLVTCHWWSDTFLNEGFARYFQFFATAELEPSWELDRQFVVAQVQPMLASDSSDSAKPLSYEASSPEEVSKRFSLVSYNKGASILRWLTYILGYENFQKGVEQYLKNNKLGTSKPETLWSELEEFIPENLLPDDLNKVIENWIVEAGYPVLNVKSEGNNVTISQNRFLLSGTSPTKWYIPISYTLSSDINKFENTSTKLWLKPDDPNVTISNVMNNKNDWIILNNQEIGYYRVNYDTNLWDRIQRAISSPGLGGIHDLNRAQLVDDIYNLAKIGQVPYSLVFNFYQFLSKDNSYYPWYSALNAFSDMLQRTENENIRKHLSDYIKELIEVLYNTHPFNKPDDDNQIYTFNRVQAATWACRLEIPDCIDNALVAFNNYTISKINPDKNLKPVIYCNGLRHSKDPKADWDLLWENYKATKLASEKTTIISALGCSTDRAVLEKYLKKSIDSLSGIRQQDALSVFSAVYTQNPEGVDIALKFFIDNYRDIADYYGSMNSLSTLLSGLANRFTSKNQTDKLEEFLNTAQDIDDIKPSALTALQDARANLQLIEAFEKEVQTYFLRGTADSIKVGVLTLVTTVTILIYQTICY